MLPPSPPLVLSILAGFAAAACGSGGNYARVIDAGGSASSRGDTAPTSDAGQGGDTNRGGAGGMIVGSGGTVAPAQGGHGGTVGGGGTIGGGGRGGASNSTGGTAGIAGRGGSAPPVGSGGSAGGGGNGGNTTSPGSGGNVGTGGSTPPGSGGGGGRPSGSGGVGSGGTTTASGGAGGSAPAGPRIISVDFVGGGPAGAPGTVAMGQTEMAGVKPAMRWNSAADAAGSLPSLTLADGSSVTASLVWNSPVGGSATGTYQIGYTDLPGDTRMMNGYLDPGDPAMPATITVSGLPTSFTATGYDVYVYAAGYLPSGTRTYTYAIGSIATIVSQTGPSGTMFPGYRLAPNMGIGNYVVFKQLSTSSFTLTAKPGTGAGTQTRAPVNGIQIVAPSGS